ncbi:MAG: DUF3185 family protein [Phycisphaeraceae bacterium]|nr:DUF3185 family protein [Phycisphaeraceae bacterium]
MAVVVRILALLLLGGGVALLVLGLNAHQSGASSVARFLTGSPTKQAVMLLTGGGALVLAGVALIGAPERKVRRR